jgi:hypothetical protein
MPKFQKGSKEAKDFMRLLRARKGKSKGGMIKPFNMTHPEVDSDDSDSEDHSKIPNMFNKPHQKIKWWKKDPNGLGGVGIQMTKSNRPSQSDTAQPYGRPQPVLTTQEGIGLGLGAGITEIHHHHHHHHMSGEGWFDSISRAFDPKRNGVANAFDPNRNGLADSARKTFTPELGNQIVGGLKTAGHYGIPIVTGAIGSTLGGIASLGNPVGEFAGGQAGKMAGQQINKAIGIGLKKGRGRPRKHSGEGISGYGKVY